MKVFCLDFLYLQFGFVIFWQNNIVSKVACIILVRLATVINFTNILRAVFCQKCICSFSLVAVWLCNFLLKNMSIKPAHKMLVKLITGRIRKSNIDHRTSTPEVSSGHHTHHVIFLLTIEPKKLDRFKIMNKF